MFFFQNHNNLPLPKGILLMGVQGCGKSLAVKMAAGVLGLPLYRLDISKLYSKYIGEREENLRKSFNIVERLSPLCLWIDEIEKVFSSSSGEIDGGVSQRVLGAFLTWMQERQDSSFIAATANNVKQIPPEFLRKGRLDEVFFVDLPSDEERKEIFRIHFKNRNLDPQNFDLASLAAASQNFNGAEVEQAIISALYTCAAKNAGVETKDVLEEIYSTKPLAVLRSEDIAELRTWALGRTVSV